MNTIDLSLLPKPTVIEELDFEVILAARKQELIDAATASSAAFGAQMAQVLAVESDPLTKQLEVSAYRELLLRKRVNDAAAATMLAYSTGSDLDHIGVTYYNNTVRLVVDPGDPAAIPPIDPIYESDERYILRCQLSLYARSTAGPKNAYVYHAMSADADVLCVNPLPHTPAPGDATIVIASATGDGTASQALIDTVQAALAPEDVRPMNDTPIVQSATVVNWSLDATLIFYPDANTTLGLQLANEAAVKYAVDHHIIDHDINLSALDAVLHVPGVQKVVINSPVADVAISETEISWNTGITLAIGGTAT